MLKASRPQTGTLGTYTTIGALHARVGANVVDWRSVRTKRVVRSTLAGESIAIDSTADTTNSGDRKREI